MEATFHASQLADLQVEGTVGGEWCIILRETLARAARGWVGLLYLVEIIAVTYWFCGMRGVVSVQRFAQERH